MKMNYKLAKQLKDAGFPQGRPLHHLPYLSGKIKEERAEMFKRFYVPTLSELIEACGETSKDKNYVTFFALEFQEDNLWHSGYNLPIPYEGNYLCYDISGKTPEEAVAKLWLKLNEIS